MSWKKEKLNRKHDKYLNKKKKKITSRYLAKFDLFIIFGDFDDVFKFYIFCAQMTFYLFVINN